MRDVILTDRGPKPIGPYSQAIRTNGFLYVSGQVALDPKTGDLTGADIRQQTEPAASRIPFTFSSARSVCCWMFAPVRSPVFGSRATCPETSTPPFVRMASAYRTMRFAPQS